MLNQPIVEQLKELKLSGVLRAWELQQSDTRFHSLSFEERLAHCAEAEIHDRSQKRQTRLLNQAKLKQSGACIEDINYTARRGLDKAQVSSLALCQWVEENQNVIITGPTGVGKTWLACALAMQVIRRGWPVLYLRVSRFLEQTAIARADGSLPKLRVRLAKCHLLILDDWGLSPLTEVGRQDLLECIDDRSGNGSIILASQLPIKSWYDYIGEPTLADAILDRIVHRSHKLELQGASMRKRVGMGSATKEGKL
ncbi:IS21-like element helper ATPase IstB [Marinagarivorans cellulosilyticus]|uniref:AAA+ ATPase domain-containing protein n=1 Tax=Marinagarivorans cellulosilyticus TaxID=2721545 RepID=A0AAN1WJR7_9GAMM|nr:IS21-like element helper ATPase IstB [Marinagarivorans cellulosilyticus]BCD98849.1 hypothetical protein MARGE09_P3050 [Marinagarivorans cellulosilyticus]